MEKPIIKSLRLNRLHRMLPIVFCLAMVSRSFGQCLPHTIFTPEAENVLYACPGDGKPDNFTILKTDTSNLKYSFVLSDIADNIIRLQTSPNFNFDGTTITSFRIWGLSYTDSVKFTVGQDVSTISAITGCARLSENVLMVVRDLPKPLSVFLENGRPDTSICLNNNTQDTLTIEIQGISNSKRLYLFTRFGGVIVDTFSSTRFVVEGTAQESFFVHAMTYTGNLNIIKNVSKISDKNLSSGCFVVGITAARVNLDTLVRGTIQSLTPQSLFCPLDNKADIYELRVLNGISPFTAFILINENSIVQQVYTSPTFDLNNNPDGKYSILALQYSGALLIKPGDTVSRSSQASLSTDCFLWATNDLEVFLLRPSAGKIQATTGDTILFGCPGDRLPDRYTFTVTGNSINNYVIVAINAQNKVLAMTLPGGFLDFEQFSPGVIKIVGVSYSGNLLININSNFTGALSSDCYAISTNQLTANLDVAKGGTIRMADGQTTYFTCPNNPGPKKLLFSRQDASNSPYQYVLTTDGGNIVEFVVNDSLLFENTSLNSMRIYGVAYSGTRIISKQSNLFVSSFSDGCYSISGNFIRVIREQPRGGGIRLPDGSNKELFCPSDTQSKLVQVRNVDVTLHPYSLVLTDEFKKVLQITPGFTFNFQGLSEGLYRIYGVSYAGSIQLVVGDTLDFTKFSSECFSFSSNNIEIIIGEINGGVLTSSEGSTTVYVCPANLDLDLIRIIPQNTRSLSYRFIITDLQNIITGFSSVDLINFGSGVINTSCRVYGVAYKGDFTGTLNKNVLQSVFSNNCYDLTDNFITVHKTVPPPHRIQTNKLDSVLTICSGDSKADSIQFSTSDSVGFNTVYLMVDFNNKILKVVSNPIIDFNKDSVGLTRLYSVIYTGRLLVSPGLSLISGLAIADDCFSLSSNSILVDIIKQGPFCVVTSYAEEDWIKKFSVFPNPARDRVSVELNLVQTNRLQAQIDITDLNGRLIRQSSRILNTDNLFSLSVDYLAEGIYLIQVKSGAFTATRKLVISR